MKADYNKINILSKRIQTFGEININNRVSYLHLLKSLKEETDKIDLPSEKKMNESIDRLIKDMRSSNVKFPYYSMHRGKPLQELKTFKFTVYANAMLKHYNEVLILISGEPSKYLTQSFDDLCEGLRINYGVHHEAEINKAIEDAQKFLEESLNKLKSY